MSMGHDLAMQNDCYLASLSQRGINEDYDYDKVASYI